MKVDMRTNKAVVNTLLPLTSTEVHLQELASMRVTGIQNTHPNDKS